MTENQSYYKNLKVWQKAIDFVESIYKTLATFPKNEMYALVDQMKRSSVSIASNIAEGSGRGSEAEYIRFLYIAKGSAQELETQLIIAERLGFIAQEKEQELQSVLGEIIKMLVGLISHKKSL